MADNDQILQTLTSINNRLEGIENRLGNVEHGQARLEEGQKHLEQGQAQTNKLLDQLTDDMAGFFHQTWEKMDETNERVTIIEDHLGLPNPTKN